MHEKYLTIIPARGGSKRLPGKNKLKLGGIPLIAHSIRYARQNRDIIERIIVSTDDPEIKAISLEEGAEVIDRPINISGDATPTISVLEHVLENLKVNIKNVVLLQPTNPLRPENLLREALQRFSAGDIDSLITVSQNFQKFGKIENDRFIPVNYKIGQRSQDLEPIYIENGLLYITKASLIQDRKLLGERNFPFIVDHPFSEVDIDFQKDLDYAEFLLQREKKINS